MIRKLTTVVVVDEIEPALATWEALGFSRTVEVPHGDHLGFVILAGPAGTELMLQTRASIREDLGEVPPLALYADVDSLDGAMAEIPGARIVIDRRTTPYGATERWLRDPAGTLVGLACSRGNGAP